MALDLMPVSTEAPRCSEFARSIDLLPPGTGLFLDRVVLVSVPLPWPKPALNHELLRPLATSLAASAVATRLFAAEPTSDKQTVEVFERAGNATIGCRWDVSEPSLVPRIIEAVAQTAVGDLAAVPGGFTQAGTLIEPVPPTFLVCTQGSHDSCCGTSGVALADAIEAKRNYTVRRVSHTGGHRFSPTFLALPAGRMWAFADMDLVDRVATGHLTAHDFSHHARGWWGAKVGAAQVAECAVRSERPDLANDIAELELLTADAGAATTRFAVTVAGTSWLVDVSVGRTVPSIACEVPGGVPAKPGREFAWSISLR